MNKILLLVLSLSLSGSLIGILLFLLKPVIKNRLSKTWQYYIYLIVILRLLLPIGPDTNLMSLIFYPAAAHVTAQDDTATQPNSNSLMLPAGETPQNQADANTLSPTLTLNSLKNMLIPWLWLVWLIPAILLFLRKVIRYNRSIHAIRNGCSTITDSHMTEIYCKTCKAMAVNHPPELVSNSRIPTPILAGIIRPAILLPDADLEDADLPYILQHELTHYKRYDIAYKWLMQIALCLHWFNPFIYRISREVNRNCELSCDETVINRLDETGKYAYGDMLIHAIRLDKTPHRTTVSITLSEDSKLIKERLGAIMTHKKQPRTVFLCSVLLSVFLFCGAAFAGVYTSKPETQSMGTPSIQEENISNNTPITIDNMEIRYYEDEKPAGRWPYVHWLISNTSDRIITHYEMTLLAYDENGGPLELIWMQTPLTQGIQVTGYTSPSDPSYEQLVTPPESQLLPGTIEDLHGGWSLWDGWNQITGTHVVTYVPACIKQVTFEDGTMWENPEYPNWLNTYKGKPIDPEILTAYYQ